MNMSRLLQQNHLKIIGIDERNPVFASMARFLGNGISPLEFTRLPIDSYMENIYGIVSKNKFHLLCKNRLLEPDTMHQLTIRAAKESLFLWERENPTDTRPADAIKAKMGWLCGDKNNGDLQIARAASWKAAWNNFYADGYAARAAARAAGLNPWPDWVADEAVYAIIKDLEGADPVIIRDREIEFWDTIFSYLEELLGAPAH